MFLKVLENEARNARPSAGRRRDFQDSHLEVRMFNVGHGEAILIVFEGERAWIVDCGNNSQPRNELLGRRLVDHLEQRDLILEAIIPTHPHFDHAGAFETILRSASSNIASPLFIYRSEDPTWHSTKGWRKRFWDAVEDRQERPGGIEEIALRDAHHELNVSDGVEAHLFAGSGHRAYTSLFVHLRYRDARFLFTGDAHCGYEIDLANRFGEEDFLADVLKVTHHGSSSGTAFSVVQAVRPGIAIASTGHDAGHRLEQDTLNRLGGHLGRPPRGARDVRAVFETIVYGDIILRTDGRPYRTGLLYQVEFDSPGEFAAPLQVELMKQEDIHRTFSFHSDCEQANS